MRELTLAEKRIIFYFTGLQYLDDFIVSWEIYQLDLCNLITQKIGISFKEMLTHISIHSSFIYYRKLNFLYMMNCMLICEQFLFLYGLLSKNCRLFFSFKETIQK